MTEELQTIPTETHPIIASTLHKKRPIDVQRTLERVVDGQEITVEERRRAIALLLTEDEVSMVEMSRFFGVNEKTIRRDKKVIDDERVESVSEDADVKLIIADLIRSRDQSLQRIEKAMNKVKAAEEGSALWLKYVQAKHDIHLKTVKELSNIGALPKNLGTQHINKTVFVCHVQNDGTVFTRPAIEGELTTAQVLEARPLDMFDDIKEGETVEAAIERRKRERQALIVAQQPKQLPAVGETTDGTASEQHEDAN